MTRIDLNCDLGEGAGRDEELMPFVTSANIACGAHAGDRETMRQTIAIARRHGVGIGAHPGFADRRNFGRRECRLSPTELRRLVIDQIEALRELSPVRHVKLHGALYNLAARDRAVAEIVAEAVHAIDPALMLFALAESELISAGRAKGLRVVGEFFADRTYRRDGSLTPRSEHGAMIEDEAEAVAQVLQFVTAGVIRAASGELVPIRAGTICLHGDGKNAVAFARRLVAGLTEAGVKIETVQAGDA